MTDSIFREYFTEPAFVDRLARSAPDEGVTVIIPVIHTNELWRANLNSVYREIPVAELLIGDGGCIDDSVLIAKEFPRVTVLDHRQYRTLGYSIRKLIESVKTEWFIYLHSDVYLPPGWFDEMAKHRSTYDWFGSRQRHTVLVEYDLGFGGRPWAGSQMGRKSAFEGGLDRIDDDYVYRQEDYVFAEVVESNGFREGKVEGTYHYHQTIFKESPWARRVRAVTLDVETTPEENVRQWEMQAKGIVKYLQPSSWALAYEVARGNKVLSKNGAPSKRATRAWIRDTNPAWSRRVTVATLALNTREAYRVVVEAPQRIVRRLLARQRIEH